MAWKGKKHRTVIHRTVGGKLLPSILDDSEPAEALKEALDEGVITEQEYQQLLRG